MDNLSIQRKAKIQSRAIDLLRFPMAVMVVFIHQCPAFLSSPSSYEDYALNVLYSAGSNIIPKVAVPLFFFISGYLYFYNLKTWNRHTYLAKTKKRFRSLFLPYIYWNIIAFVFYKLISAASSIWHGESYDLSHIFTEVGWHTFWDGSKWSGDMRCFGLFESVGGTGPIDGPLWFVRNLIILMAFSPVVYFCVKKCGGVAIALLGMAFLSNIWIDYSPLDISGIFFFSFGAWLSINNKDIMDFFRQIKVPAYITTILLVPVCVWLDLTKGNLMLAKPMFIICCMISAYCLMYNFVKNGGGRKFPQVLTQACFFIFAFHALCVNNWTTIVVLRCLKTLLFFSPTAAIVITYIVSPFVISLLCVAVYVVMKKYVPALLGALTGNR